MVKQDMENQPEIIIVLLAKAPDFAINSDRDGQQADGRLKPTARQWPGLAVEN
jgi:hypothetical protein